MNELIVGIAIGAAFLITAYFVWRYFRTKTYRAFIVSSAPPQKHRRQTCGCATPPMPTADPVVGLEMSGFDPSAFKGIFDSGIVGNAAQQNMMNEAFSKEAMQRATCHDLKDDTVLRELKYDNAFLYKPDFSKDALATGPCKDYIPRPISNPNNLGTDIGPRLMFGIDP